MKDSKENIAGRCLSYMFFIAITAETTFLHFKTWKLEEQLTKKMDINIKPSQEKTSLIRNMEALTFHEKIIKEMKYVTGVTRSRTKRDAESENLSTWKLLKSIHQYLMQGKNSKCNNVTLVCRKGERGRKGKTGPRGMKGDTGAKGKRGDVGPIGTQGPAGHPGKQGRKGEPGLPGRSIEKPQIVTKLQKTLNATENSNVTIFCEAKGNPEPEIFWKFEKQQKDSRYSFPLKGALEIENINSRDAGKIRCIAKNIPGQATTATQLLVHTTPKVSLLAEKIRAITGQPLEMYCNATGKPRPRIAWKKGFGHISGVTVLSKDGSSLKLQIKKPIWTDAGFYICKAENYVGMTKKLLNVQIDYAIDCSAIKRRGQTSSGLYMIKPDLGIPFKVYCDMTTAGGGWTVTQRRMDGSVDFYRDWASYKSGFGDLAGEFWIGNEKIHRLTKRKNTMIRFELEDVDGNKAFAKYDSFYVDGEANQFQLRVSSYSGTAGDAFLYHNGSKFTTKDNDKDSHNKNCAKLFDGAWWYRDCHGSNLNGKYLNGPHTSYANGVNWNAFKGLYNSLKRTVMKIRRKN